LDSTQLEALRLPTLRLSSNARRLNAQHQLILQACDNHLLDPSIPCDGVRSIADVATGTGIWLTELKDELTTSSTPKQGNENTGFDISDAQFPQNSGPDIDFVVQDMTKPFPVQYHNRYDIVHVSLIFIAIPRAQIDAAVENTLALLKPGGYIQWDEMELASEHDLWPGPAVKSGVGVIYDFMRLFGMTETPVSDLSAAFVSRGLENIVVRDYVTFRHPELVGESRAWLLQSLSSLVPLGLLRQGKTKDIEAGKVVWSQMEREVRKEFERGVEPGCPIVSIVARKGT